MNLEAALLEEIAKGGDLGPPRKRAVTNLKALNEAYDYPKARYDSLLS
jgi:hypothetical protein